MDARKPRDLYKGAALVAAAALYLVVRGLARALCLNWMGLSGAYKVLSLLFQANAKVDAMTNAQFGLFCLAGPVAVLVLGYILLSLAKRLSNRRAVFFRTLAQDVTIAFLLIDPIYLLMLSSFFGGGDLNGLAVFLTSTLARVAVGVLLAVNLWAVVGRALPLYKPAPDGRKDV